MERSAWNRAILGLSGLVLLSVWCSCFGGESNAHLTTLASCVWRQRDAVMVEASPGVPLDVRTGDRLLVDGTGRGRLEFPDLVTVEIYRSSDLTLRAEPTSDSLLVDLYLALGAVFCDTPPGERADRRVVVGTEWAQIEATGTGFIVQYEVETQITWVVVLQGRVMVAGQDQSVIATDEQVVQVNPGQVPTWPESVDALAWLNALRGGRRSGTPTFTPTPTRTRTRTPTPTRTRTRTPTPTRTRTRTPTPTRTRTRTPTPTRTRTPTPTRTPFLKIDASILYYDYDASSEYVTFRITNVQGGARIECVKTRIVNRDTSTSYYGGTSGLYNNTPFYVAPASGSTQSSLAPGATRYLRYKLTNAPYGAPCRATITLYTADNLGGTSATMTVDFDAGVAPY